MPTVAEQLKTGRDSQKLTIEQVAERTKIRGDHLRALEKGDYNVFVAPVYIRGFVRSYAAMLGLDVTAILADLDQELGQTSKFKQHPKLSGEPKSFLDLVMLQFSKVNWVIVLPVIVLGGALLGAIFGYRVWKEHKSRDPLQELGPGLYKSTNSQRGETVPLILPGATNQ